MYRELATHPDWQRGTRTRLIASLAIAGFAIVTFIITTEFTADDKPIDELEVTLVAPPEVEAPRPPVELLEPLIVEDTPRELPELAEIAESTVPDDPPDEPAPAAPDWYAEMDEVVAAVVAEGQKTWSVNPVFDARRRAAAEQFRPSRAPVKKPIWENVERDQLGRRVLVHGDCQRVIDDPNVGSNEFFRIFGQYIVTCSNYKYVPQELPWVDEVRDRRVFLAPDPEIRNDSRRDLVALAVPQE
ncbi:MAG: hypothetical protein QNI96_09640 [Woeseiaceae bacterium]|nr:hypothetical protein [Woeseiaceae bacterium]